MSPVYQRALLKISGEAFGGARGRGFDGAEISRIGAEIAQSALKGRQLAVVVGGGNILRGAELDDLNVPSMVGDQMGMTATVLNAIALKWSIIEAGASAHVMCAFQVGSFVDTFSLEEALSLLDAGTVVIFAGGTGNPCFTTDTAAALRAVEMRADVMVKCTQVDGVYDKDPKIHPDAVRIEEIGADEIVQKGLAVVDAACADLLRRKKLLGIVLNLHRPGNIDKALAGAKVGTLIR
jgi:uridylate kinase